MSGWLSGGAGAWLAGGGAGAALLVLLGTEPGARRAAELPTAWPPAWSHDRPVVGRPAKDRSASAGRSPGAGTPGGPSARSRGLAAAAAGLAVVSLVGGAIGALLGPVIALAAYRSLGRLEPRAEVARREQLARDLPLVTHLLAATVAAGASAVDALELVGSAVGEPAGPHLRRASAALRLGGDPTGAWSVAIDATALAPLARTIARALRSGAPIATSLDHLAADLRSRQRAEVERRARSVGVRAAAPLGLCFLPAFLLIGVVPVVVGMALTIAPVIG